MAAGGDGHWVLASMWSLLLVSFVFVVLRMYTRVYVIKSFGADDRMYNLAFFFLLMNTVLMTIGAQYGLGQNLMDILEEEPDHLPLSLLYEAASQTFAIIAMSIAKWSLGLFLLRLVKEKWHKIAIWCMMALSLRVPSTVLRGAKLDNSLRGRRLLLRWVPLFVHPRVTDEDERENGYSNKSQLGCHCWTIWNQAYSRGSRTQKPESHQQVSLHDSRLSTNMYQEDPIGLIVWTAAEITVTMICIAIPVCRPLYKKCFTKWTSRGSSNYPNSAAPYPLQTIGGGVLQAKRVDRNGSGSTTDTNEQVEEHERKMGVNGPFTRTRVYPKIDERRIGGDQSKEEILGPEFRRSQIMDLEAQNGRTMSTRHTNNSERSI
uniref:Rhodopsin domain-containing protein n=1 Tax=Gibberella zeae TaxID=5518 RepID=A0A4E9DTE4_GIBZA